MSRRRLGGWEPSVTVTYVKDRDGRQVGEKRTPEPEFNAEDRAWLEALALLEADECPNCRMPLSESTDPDGPRYEVPRPDLCRSCLSVHDRVDQYRDSALPIHARKFHVTQRGHR